MASYLDIISSRTGKGQALGVKPILLLSVSSIVFFLLTVNSLSILEYPADALYYVKSLPYYYWLGLATTLLSIVIPFWLKTPSSSYLRILPLILLGIYVYGTPIFTYEIPRFMDVFSHGGEAISIISTGSIDPQYSYSREYPNAFIFMAMSVITENIGAFFFFRFIELLTMLLLIVLIYLITKLVVPAYGAVGSLAFVGAYWVDQGHFSPQGIAIILYAVFFLCLIKAITSKTNRNWLILAILMIFAVNLTSPTNSFFLLLNLLMIVATGYIIMKKISKKIAYLAFISSIIFFAWSTYNAESHTILKAEQFGEEIAGKFGSLEGIKITPAPADSYLFVNNLRLFVIMFVIVSGIGLSIFLIRKKSTPEYTILLVGWFASTLFIVISMYISPVLLSRNFMYAIFPWCFLIGSFLAAKNKRKWYNGVKLALLFCIVLIVLISPITRYGRDPTTYVPASMVNSAELIAERSNEGTVVAYSMGANVEKYFKSLASSNIEVKRYVFLFEKAFAEGRINLLDDWIAQQLLSPNDKIIFSEPERNIIDLKYSEGKLYEKFENDAQNKYNLIVNSGVARVYSKELE